MTTRNPKALKRAATLVVLAGLWIAGSARAAVEVEIASNGIDVTCADATPRETLDAVAGAFGARVEGTVHRDGSLTMRLTGVPASTAISRILGEQSFVVRYRADGTPRVVELLGMPARARANASVAEGAGDLFKSFTGGMTTHVSPRLARVLGTPEPSLYDLLVASSSLPEPRLREAAIEALARGVEERPLLASLTLRALDTVDKSTVAESFSYLAGHRARRVLTRIAARSQLPAVREWAYEMRAGLPAQAGAEGDASRSLDLYTESEQAIR